MADWVTISQIATAGGTLVLAIATFGSIKSANRSARVAEQALMAGVRPMLIPSGEDDQPERVRFGDGEVLTVAGHGAAFRIPKEGSNRGNIYLSIALRNGGTGLAVIHGWHVETPTEGRNVQAQVQPDPANFRRQLRDLYLPPGYTGFWQGAIRDREDPDYDWVYRLDAAGGERRIMVDVLYGDYSGAQRAIARFSVSEWEGVTGERADVLRYWNVDGDSPR
jgi:hypothetical protein